MFNKIDLRKLVALSAPDRAFLSIYLSSPDSMDYLNRRLKNIEKMLQDNDDECTHFKENVKIVDDYFDGGSYKSGSLIIFCCWLVDYFRALPLDNITVDDLVLVDSSPYIRPIAELQDEYENFAVVVADNQAARIFLVSSASAGHEEQIKGNIKNHVKVGGWSQKRYERRRTKELKTYTNEIVDTLNDFEKQFDFDRLVLVGSGETIREIENNLPQHLSDKLAGESTLDLKESDNYINEEIFELFFEEEREAEGELWELIKGEYMRGGLAVVGAEDVLAAAKIGKIEKVIVNRDVQLDGIRCRECEVLNPGALEQCPTCGSDSVFKVDLVNEIVELLVETSAEADFADEIEDLHELGDIAALLRY